MHRGLLWALVATCAATAVTLWTGRQAPVIVAAVGRSGSGAWDAALPAADGRAPVAPATALPLRIAAVSIEPVQRDPFVPLQPPAPKPPPAPPPPPVVMLPPPPPAAPSAPAVKARFLGRMVTPAGDTLVFLSSADKTWLARPGDELEEGYVIDAVTEQSVVLAYPALSVKVTLPLPAAPGP
jgi:hypothetical protein